MTKYEHFAISKNGITVVYDPVGSHAATHFADTPQIKPHVRDILRQTNIQGQIMEFDTDTGHTIGTSDLVQTDVSDTIVFAKRKNRQHYSRFTTTKKAQLSSVVTISLTKIDDTTYELFSAWLGRLTPPFPGSPMQNELSIPFWSNHALVWGTQEVQPGTETNNCPW